METVEQKMERMARLIGVSVRWHIGDGFYLSGTVEDIIITNERTMDYLIVTPLGQETIRTGAWVEEHMCRSDEVQ